MKKNLKYISSGAYKTGGFAHEQIFAQGLAQALLAQYYEIRFQKQFKGPLQWIQLFFKTFTHANNAQYIVTTARLAWPVYFRHLFTKCQIWIVLHNYDPNDGKPKLYYKMLNAFIKYIAASSSAITIVCISQYWQQVFNKLSCNKAKTVVFPNLFDVPKLQFFRDISSKSPGLIHLGQWSDKIDKKQYLNLIYLLNNAGFTCYFSSNVVKEVHGFPISYFQTYEGYLKQMARSHATIILNKVNEGWPRLVHESFLLGTQVFTTNTGGIEPLINAGNGYKLDTVEQIVKNLQLPLKPIIYTELEKYNSLNVSLFAEQCLAQVQPTH